MIETNRMILNEVGIVEDVEKRFHLKKFVVAVAVVVVVVVVGLDDEDIEK